jgi:hypothetical protein
VGHDLTRMLRASVVFPTATTGEQAVALIIADICNDITRKPPRNMNAGASVCADMGITLGSLGNILAKLAARGLELRVPIGTDKRGRRVYAANRHAVDYLFPVLPPRATKAPLTDGPFANEGPSSDGPMEPEGPSLDGQRSIAGWTPTPMTPKSKEDAPAAAPQLAQDQDPSQDQTPGGTFPPDPPGRPPSSADRDISSLPISAPARRVGVPPEGAEGAAFEDSNPSVPAPVKTGSVAKSQNRRLPDGSETMADDAQESPPNRAERSGANRYAGACEAEPPGHPDTLKRAS